MYFRQYSTRNLRYGIVYWAKDVNLREEGIMYTPTKIERGFDYKHDSNKTSFKLELIF